MRALALVAVVALAAALPTRASAQQTFAFAGPSPEGAIVLHTTRAGDPPVARVRTWLRNLASAEEGYYAEHGTYTTDLVPLGVGPDLAGPFKSDSVHVAVVHAGGRSWAATATHLAVQGRSCAMFVGDARDFPTMPRTAGGIAPTEAGAVVCDRF